MVDSDINLSEFPHNRFRREDWLERCDPESTGQLKLHSRVFNLFSSDLRRTKKRTYLLINNLLPLLDLLHGDDTRL